ncbi:MAG: hypothetical protein ACK46X_07460 [Candidatus Sericytochromatia bacterium]
MTQLRIRRKPEPAQRPTLTLVPMAAILGLGIASTFLFEAGKMAPNDAVEAAAPRLGAAFETAQGAYLAWQRFSVNGKEWVAASHPVATFDPAEMVPAGSSGGWNLMANRYRGLAALSRKPSGYDRLYVELGAGRYAPLRWRHVP